MNKYQGYGDQTGADSASQQNNANGRKPENGGWPKPLDPAAFHGVAGELVKRLDPHTEADSAAILFQTLTAFGNLIGRKAYFLVEEDRHFGNLNVVLVGRTSKARKGTSWGRVSAVFKEIDPLWLPTSGLSTGEGLIWAVRDRAGEEAGVDDKRLLVMEPEFARVLQSARRKENTLSPVIRQAWDTGDLRIINKNSPVIATGAHIALIGHITKDELVRSLTETESANGFANRFLWVCVRRSKLLPEGGTARQKDFADITDKFGQAVRFAQSAERLQRDEPTRERWLCVYEALSADKPGLLGAVTSRSEAQVTRLSLVYALLDSSPVIRLPHLEAALAAWHYCEDSARFIFGDLLGDPIADTVMAELRKAAEHGLTRTEISAQLGRHAPASEINRALDKLASEGLARSRTERTDGRYAERWLYIPSSAK